MSNSLPSRNRNTLLLLLAVVLAMAGVAAASPLLYSAFCRLTGFGGTTQRAVVAPGPTGERTLKIEFNADVSPELPWEFAPDQRRVPVRLGEGRVISYHAKNLGTEPVTGVALYNVTPDKAGLYFNKIQCFCFDNQTLAPGERRDFPVQFFVDPALATDPDLDDVTTITLSYTFFKAKSQALEEAKTKGYQE